MSAAHAQSELPLSGSAYLLANQAYKAYDRGNYAEAIEKSREALRQRPDVKQLRVLLKKSEAAQLAAVRPESPARTATRRTAPAPTPNLDPGYSAASAGYKAFERGDFSEAVIYAGQAVQLAPAKHDYRLLLINALFAANRLAEADLAISHAIAQTADDSKLLAQQSQLRERMAQTPATEAYAALQRRDSPAAIASARRAVGLAPTNPAYRMALLQALLQAELFENAESEASETLALIPTDPSVMVLRAYSRQRLGRRSQAVVDLDRALAQPGLSAAGQRQIRLIAADASLAASEPQRALDLLEGLPPTGDVEAASRLRAARSALSVSGSIRQPGTNTANFAAPTLDCGSQDGPQLCSVIPGVVREPGFEAAAAAYKAFDDGKFAEAAVNARRALELSPGRRDYQLLLVNAYYRAEQFSQAEEAATVSLLADNRDAALFAQRGFIRQRLGLAVLAKEDFEAALAIGQLPETTEIGLLADLGRKQEARQRFDTAIAGGKFAGLSDMEIAYLAAKVGDDEKALAAFNSADVSRKLANTAYQDAAFAALHSRNDAQAINYFKRTIDDVNQLKLRMEPQLLFNTRRAVAEISRETGVIASLTYRGAVSGLGLVPGAGSNNLQGGVEGYWRPLGYRDGRYVELFARAFETLYSKDGATGSGTLQAALGIRYKPFSGTNFVTSFSRVFSSSGGRNDWLAQLGYSDGSGTDLRVDVPSWWTTRVSAEAGRYLTSRQSYALAELQAGRSFRLGDAQARWVLFPHSSLAADYDSRAVEQTAIGLGPGITARYWFNEDVYSAPRSYVDLSLQYRFRVSGARRGQGLFVNTTLSY